MVSKFVTQLQLQLHLYTISSNGSIVFDFSKQLNDQPFAFKDVDFALVVSTFKPPGINLDNAITGEMCFTS